MKNDKRNEKFYSVQVSREVNNQIQRLLSQSKKKEGEELARDYLENEKKVRKYMTRIEKLNNEEKFKQYKGFLCEEGFLTSFCLTSRLSNVRSPRDGFGEYMEKIYHTTKGIVRSFPIYGADIYSKEDFYLCVRENVFLSFEENIPKLFDLFFRSFNNYFAEIDSTTVNRYKREGGGVEELKFKYLVKRFPDLVSYSMFTIYDADFFFSSKVNGTKLFEDKKSIEEFLGKLDLYHQMSKKRISFCFRTLHQGNGFDHENYSGRFGVTDFSLRYPTLKELTSRIDVPQDQINFLNNFSQLEYTKKPPFLRDQISKNFKEAYSESGGSLSKHFKNEKEKEDLTQNLIRLQDEDAMVLHHPEKLLLLGFFLSSHVKDMKQYEGRNEDDSRIRARINTRYSKRKKVTTLEEVYHFTDNLSINMKKNQPKTRVDINWNDSISPLIDGGWIVPVKGENDEEYSKMVSEEFKVLLAPEMAAKISNSLGIKIESFYCE